MKLAALCAMKIWLGGTWAWRAASAWLISPASSALRTLLAQRACSVAAQMPLGLYVSRAPRLSSARLGNSHWSMTWSGRHSAVVSMGWGGLQDHALLRENADRPGEIGCYSSGSPSDGAFVLRDYGSIQTQRLWSATPRRCRRGCALSGALGSAWSTSHLLHP